MPLVSNNVNWIQQIILTNYDKPFTECSTKNEMKSTKKAETNDKRMNYGVMKMKEKNSQFSSFICSWFKNCFYCINLFLPLIRILAFGGNIF